MKKLEVLGKILLKDQQKLIKGGNRDDNDSGDAKFGKCCVNNECSVCTQDPDCGPLATFVKC
jgi:hypothetical protein